MQNMEEIIRTAVKNIRDGIDVDEIVGKPIVNGDGTLILPVSRISFGFVSGGGDGEKKDTNAATGIGVAGGITVAPVGFLVCGRDKKFITVDKNDGSNKWMELARATLNAMKKDED